MSPRPSPRPRSPPFNGYGEYENLPKEKRISDANKAELQESGWLRERLPNQGDGIEFMKWLERGHKEGEAHEHLRPGSSQALEKLREWADYAGKRLARDD